MSGEPFFKHLEASRTFHILLTAETDEFDETIQQDWADEGYNTVYVPLGDGGAEYIRQLHNVADKLTGVSDRYAIVAYGAAASAVLEAHTKPTPRLAALIAYYPTSIPDPKASSHGHSPFPFGLHVLVHLCGTTIGVRRNPEILGIQGKRRTVQRRVQPTLGIGGKMALPFPAYVYQGLEAGFAESDLDEFDAVAADLAWTRSLRFVRAGFGAAGEVDVEGLRDGFLEDTREGNVEKALQSLHSLPHVLHTPTMAGGFGHKEIEQFYTEFYGDADSAITTTLLSRTIGTDRCVDELHLSFDHTVEIPWMLPRIPPSGKHVDIVVVSIVCVKGGRLVHEHIYWDQASVLVQIGLLDPGLVPDAWTKKGVKTLPVTGSESALAVLQEKGKVNTFFEA